MRNLLARIERLEEVYSPPEIRVMLLTFYGTATKGYGTEHLYIPKKSGESDDELANRAEAEAKAYYREHPSLLLAHEFIVLMQDVEHAVCVKPDPKPLSTPEPAPEPRAPEPRMALKPPTITGIEGQYTDRRHWMA